MLIEIGLSHHHVGSIDLSALAATLAHLSSLPVSGYVALSTCNRFELYLDADEFHPSVDAVRALIVDHLDQSLHRLADEMVVHVSEAAVEHLFTVAAGLDSMVIGDEQISAQVKAALNADYSRPTPILHRLFRSALTAAKAVCTKANLGKSGRSLASVGLDLVESRHGPIARQRVLLVGTGSYARVALAELLRRGVDDICVWSATGRAELFASSHPVMAVNDLATALAEADMAVACSGSRTQPLSLAVIPIDRESIVPILDLALGGSVAPEVAGLAVVDVINLDEIGAHAPDEDATSLITATDIVAKSVEAYCHLETGRRADPMIMAIRAHISTIIAAETEQARRRYSPETANAVSRSLHRVSNALLHTPSLRAAELARAGELDDYARALHTLFGIDVSAQG